MYVMYANSDITFFDVIPVDCHIGVSVWFSVHVIKTQCMHQLVFNCHQLEAPNSKWAGFEVKFLAL